MARLMFRSAAEMVAAHASYAEMKTERDAAYARMDYLIRSAQQAGRDLPADDQREYDALEAIVNDVSERAAADEAFILAQRRGVVAPDPDPSPLYRDGQPLTREQSFSGFACALGHAAGYDEPDAPLSLARCLRGAMTGDWRNADAEHRAMSGSTTGAGGFMLPPALSARIIDLARAQTRVLEAGATVVPMDAREVDVARWAADPEPGWRAENAAIPESDGLLERVTLTARSLAVVTKVSRELVEDTDVDDQLLAAFAASFARKVDGAALYGSGTAPEPTGVKATTAVTKTPLATNGAAPTWDALVDSAGRLRDANETPTAHILSDRTGRSLAKVKGSDGQYVVPPTYLDGIPRLTTSGVPTTLTVGTSTDTSDVFTADWSQLYVGVRIGLTVTLLEERFMPDAGQFGFVGWWRGDIQVARPKAFDVVTGIRA